jgi:mannosyltransferase OCH1-like enzyme
MIPKIVHFIWLQGEAHLRAHQPVFWQNVLRSREIFGNEWQVKLWDEETILPLVSSFPGLAGRYAALDKLAMKADVARFAILKEYGGIYLDVDFLVERSLAPLCNLANEPYVALRRLRFGSFLQSILNGTLSSTPESLQNYLIISSAKHPLWELLLQHVVTFRRRSAFEHPALYYARFTCLNALGRAVDRYRKQHPKPTPVIFITHVTDFYGKHVGKGNWAGWLTTYGRTRHAVAQDLNWLCAASLMGNVVLLALLMLVMILLGRI